ncbi:MAG: hypothetical protein EON60_10555 [Alphaproteobacteria bacterium]|nr:MAG: hypothetical protein EON60_10555 [Alphaproteobacteria bacterium]
MIRFLPALGRGALKRGLWRFTVFKQQLVNRVLSNMYGQPVQVLPAGHVGVAAALVLWTVQDGGRQLVFVRNPRAKDIRARLVSVMGLGKHADMAVAMIAAARAQVGDVFVKTLKLDKLSLDRVAAAPMFVYTDEGNGIVTPVQILLWVQQVQPVQLELMKLQAGCELVTVSEQALLQGRAHGVSSTHVAMWKAVARHLPQKILPREDDAEAREERVAEAERNSGKVLH